MAGYNNYSQSNMPNNLGFNQYASSPSYFPQPNGNVYSINNALEIANVPVGAGMSVALCFPENLMYIKSMQNGSPILWVYKISQYTPNSTDASSSVNQKQEIKNEDDKQLAEDFKKYDARLNTLEQAISKLQKTNGGVTK